MKVKRMRADLACAERGLAPSRTLAQALILAGQLWSDTRRIDKPGELVADDAPLHLRAGPRFVSRGGDKLDAALHIFEPMGLVAAGRRCVDIGASTGGFTDCLLRRGAAAVVAVDVGWGQLADKLRRDERVEVLERTNARALQPGDVGGPVDLVVVDASFIGIDKLIGAIARLLRGDGDLCALVKPQFEAGREAVSRGRGVIRDPRIRDAAIAHARDAIEAGGFEIVAEVDSAVAGPRGNIERFVWARRR